MYINSFGSYFLKCFNKVSNGMHVNGGWIFYNKKNVLMESFNGCVNGNEMVVILKNVYAKVGFIFKAENH